MEMEEEQGLTVLELLTMSLELKLDSWIKAHGKSRKKPISILEEIIKEDKKSDVANKLKNVNINDLYK